MCVAVIQKGSKAKGKLVWLKTFNVWCVVFVFKKNLHVEDPALKKNDANWTSDRVLGDIWKFGNSSKADFS